MTFAVSTTLEQVLDVGATKDIKQYILIRRISEGCYCRLLVNLEEDYSIVSCSRQQDSTRYEYPLEDSGYVGEK
jgi:hypothetical protein